MFQLKKIYAKEESWKTKLEASEARSNPMRYITHLISSPWLFYRLESNRNNQIKTVMNPQTTQTFIAAAISVVFVVVVYRLGRRQKLSFRYTVGWMVLGAIGVVAGVILPLTEPLANQLSMSPAAFLGVGAVILLVTLCVQLSISISGLQEQVRTLAEEVAYLRLELHELEEKYTQIRR